MALSIYSRLSWSLNNFPTLYNHLVAGHQDLLPVAGLSVLQDGGTRLGRSSVGHGQRLQALYSICAVVGQLDGPTLGNGNYTGTWTCVRIHCISALPIQ